MKHVAIIDWAGFKDLSTAVGGVPVTIPKDTYDDSQHVMWKAGDYNLEGKKALQYVRQRHGLLRGDFDRIARQQNFLRALMGKMLSKGVTRNPVKLINTVKALTKNLTVDQEWTGGDMRGLALSLRGMQTKDVYFLSAPVAGTETIPDLRQHRAARRAQVQGAVHRVPRRQPAGLPRQVPRRHPQGRGRLTEVRSRLTLTRRRSASAELPASW